MLDSGMTIYETKELKILSLGEFGTNKFVMSSKYLYVAS